MSKPRSGQETATEDPSVGELSPYRWVPVSSHPHWYPVTPPLSPENQSSFSHPLCARESVSQSQADVYAIEIHFGFLNVKCVKWDVGLKCKIKCFVEAALWRWMKVGIEIIYACVSWINMVMRKMQLCCPCQNPERWICFTVQNAEIILCRFELNFLFTMYIYNIFSTSMNKKLIACFCFQAVGPRLSIWSTSRAPNPQFSAQEVSQLWAPQCHADWPLTPSLARLFVVPTASCVPNRPLNPARFPLWEYPAPLAWRFSPHQSLQ